MNRQRGLQTLDAPSEQHLRADHGARRVLKGWLTVPELAERLRFTVTAPADPEKACREWLRREGIASTRRGRVILVDSLDVDAALRKVTV